MAAKKKSEGLKFSPVIVSRVTTRSGGGTVVSFEVDSSQAENVAMLLLMHQDEIPAELTVKAYAG